MFFFPLTAASVDHNAMQPQDMSRVNPHLFCSCLQHAQTLIHCCISFMSMGNRIGLLMGNHNVCVHDVWVFAEYLWSKARMHQGSGLSGRLSVSPTVSAHSLVVMNEWSKNQYGNLSGAVVN